MQTFLPYPDIVESVKCLDNKRLGKQRVEAMQILKALNNPQNRWRFHPAVKMWRGYNSCLEIYMNSCIRAWVQRGFNNTMFMCQYYDDSDKWFYSHFNTLSDNPVTYPDWWGSKLHDTHKSNLLRKDPVFYGQYNWNVPNNLPYIWPT